MSESEIQKYLQVDSEIRKKLPVVTSFHEDKESFEDEKPFFEYHEMELPSGQKVCVILNIRGHSNLAQLRTFLDDKGINPTLAFIEGSSTGQRDSSLVQETVAEQGRIFDIFATDPLSHQSYRDFTKILGLIEFSERAEELWPTKIGEIIEKYFEAVGNDRDTDETINLDSLSIQIDNQKYRLQQKQVDAFLDNIAWHSISTQNSVSRFVNAWLTYAAQFDEVSMVTLHKRLSESLDMMDASGTLTTGRGDYLRLVKPAFAKADEYAEISGVTRAEIGFNDFRLLMEIINTKSAEKIIDILNQELSQDDEVLFYVGGEHREMIDRVLDSLLANEE